MRCDYETKAEPKTKLFYQPPPLLSLCSAALMKNNNYVKTFSARWPDAGQSSNLINWSSNIMKRARWTPARSSNKLPLPMPKSGNLGSSKGEATGRPAVNQQKNFSSSKFKLFNSTHLNSHKYFEPLPLPLPLDGTIFSKFCGATLHNLIVSWGFFQKAKRGVGEGGVDVFCMLEFFMIVYLYLYSRRPPLV